MKNFSLSVILDTLFSAFAGFLLSFIIFNYFTPRPYSLVFSACAAAVTALFTLRRLLLKKSKNIVGEKERRLKNDVLNQLDFSQKAQIVNLFEKAFRHKNIATERKKGGLYLPEEKIFIHFAFGFDGATKKDVVKAFNALSKDDVARVYATVFPPEVVTFAARFGGAVILKDGDDVFSFLKDADALPQIRCSLLDVRPAKRNVFKEIFKKKRAKSFMAFGIMFLLMSYFVPFRLYYIIFGSCLIMLSVICKLYGKKEDGTV